MEFNGIPCQTPPALFVILTAENAMFYKRPPIPAAPWPEPERWFEPEPFPAIA